MRVGSDSDWWVVALGAWHSCAIKADRSLWCWGDNQGGEIGSGSDAPWSGVVRIGKDTWSSIAGGQRHTCGIKTDGTLWCWGRSDAGQLGEETPDAELCKLNTMSLPCVRVPVRVGADHDWDQVSAGGLRSCALKRDGSLWCWGARDGISEATTAPTRVGADNDWVSAAVDSEMGCGLKRDRTAACWLPDLVTGAREYWKSLSVGSSHACGLTEDGRALCWGDNRNGAVGSGALDSEGFLQIGEALDWSAVVAGGWHTCGVSSRDTIECWGSNAFQQLGDGLTAHDMSCAIEDCSLEPVRVSF